MRPIVPTIAFVLLIGCQQTAPPASRVFPMGPTVAKLKEEGDELARRREWQAAAAKYQAAVNQESSNLQLHLALAIAFSHLDRRDETVEHFRWVTRHGTPGSPEVVLARSWLANAGELGDQATSTPAAPLQAPPAPGVAGGKGALKGATSWPGVEGRERPVRVRITLTGEDDTNREISLARRLNLGQSYGFQGAPPGKYRLEAKAIHGDVQVWNQTVVVEADKETTLDLTPSNSLISPKEFPPDQSAR